MQVRRAPEDANRPAQDQSTPRSSAVYDTLARSKPQREVERAFRDATGLSLKLVPADDRAPRPGRRKDENPFCALLGSHPGACAACREIQRRLRRKLARKETCCFAGMTELAVPVLVGGEHVATLVAGQVFRKKPSRRQFEQVMRQVRQWGVPDESAQIREKYFQTPVVSEKQLQGAERLVKVLATQLGESAGRYLLAAQRYEPPSVTRARNYLRAHAGERVTLGQIAEHAHVSRHHLCKIFKQATGMTLTEFVARVRVERAIGLLGDPQRRITDVAGLAGFNSISQFNRVFLRYTGKSPTAHRAALRRQARSGDVRRRAPSQPVRRKT